MVWSYGLWTFVSMDVFDLLSVAGYSCNALIICCVLRSISEMKNMYSATRFARVSKAAVIPTTRRFYPLLRRSKSSQTVEESTTAT